MWMYNGKEVHGHLDLFADCTDFVYLITYVDGKKYVGQKRVRAVRRKKPTKEQLAIRKNYVRKEMTDLPFVNYEGSLDKSECAEIASKEILYQCKDKRASTYVETALLFAHDVLFSEDYLNKNINGKYFSNAVDGLLGIGEMVERKEPARDLEKEYMAKEIDRLSRLEYPDTTGQ